MSCVSFEKAVRILIEGNVVGIPTETVYGLGGRINCESAIESIFRIKKRPNFDPLIVHIYTDEQVPTIATEFPKLPHRIAARFWPGPLTMVLPKHKNLNPLITAGLDTVGVRMPKHKLCLKLLASVRQPLAAPSANLFGNTSPTTAQHVAWEFKNKVPVLDAGACEGGIESTVIGFDKNYSKIYIYRPGLITHEQLSGLAPCEWKISPASPGQLKHHYMPQIPLVWLKTRSHLTTDQYESLKHRLNIQELRLSWLELNNDPHLAARELYGKMRRCSEKPGANCIVFTKAFAPKDPPLWRALRDRIDKASQIKI